MNRDSEENGLLDTCEALDRLCTLGPIGMGYLKELHAQTKFDPKSNLRSGFDRFRREA